MSISDNPNLAAGRDRMTRLALNLQRMFDPVDTAGLLIGAGIGVLARSIGREGTANYLAEVAQGIRDDQTAGETHGNA